MQDSRHALKRLVAGEAGVKQYHSYEGIELDDEVEINLDCKKTPGSGCESAERLWVIREGKRPSVHGGEFNSSRR